MNKIYSLFPLLVFSVLPPLFPWAIGTASASDNSPLGARSSGMGGTSVGFSDVWSTQNNQAGLGSIKEMGAGIFYQNRFMMKELSTKAVAFVLPVKSGTFGVCVSNFGYSLYNQNKIGLSFGKSFGEKISAGISLDYLSTSIPEYGKKSSFAAEAGIQAKPFKNLIIGAHIFNPTRTKLTDYNDERIPTIMRLGCTYKFSEKIILAVETEKDINRKAIQKAGIEYKPTKELYIRAGISTNPSLSSIGIGLELKNLRINISSTYHAYLGISPQIGLTYKFDKVAKAGSTQTFK